MPNADFPRRSLNIISVQDLDLAHFASAEAQAAALADGIAYNAHDIDDGLRSGLIDFAQMGEVDFLRDIGGEIAALYPGLELVRAIHELVRRLITIFIEDAIAESRRRIAASGAASVEDVRAHGAPLDRLFRDHGADRQVDLAVSVRQYVPASAADPYS